MTRVLKPFERALLLLTSVVALVLMATMSLWAIDISVSAMLGGKSTDQLLFLTNGFWDANPMQLYHLGLYMLTICTFLFAVIGTYLTLSKLVKQEKEKCK